MITIKRNQRQTDSPLSKRATAKPSKLAAITALYPRYHSDVETGRKIPPINTLALLQRGGDCVTISELVNDRTMQWEILLSKTI